MTRCSPMIAPRTAGLTNSSSNCPSALVRPNEPGPGLGELVAIGCVIMLTFASGAPSRSTTPDAGATGSPWPQPASTASAHAGIKAKRSLLIWIFTHVLSEAASLQRNGVTVRDRRQRPVQEDVDRLGNELYRSVTHGHIKTARVQASPAPFTSV